MTTIDIDIDEYLDEASDYSLFNEVLRRLKRGAAGKVPGNREEVIKELRAALEDNNDPLVGWPTVNTLSVVAKQDWVRDNWDTFNPPSPGGPQIDCPVCKCKI